MMAQASLAGGFADRPRDSATAFRAILDAMARPGTIVDISGTAPPTGLSVAAGTVLAVLTDGETPLWLPDRLSGSVAEWLTFHTNAPHTVDRDSAMFAAGRWDELAPFDSWPIGTDTYPDRSATLIVEMDSLDGGPARTLRGPGIRTTAPLTAALPEDLIAALAGNRMLFPCGVDVILTAGDRLLGLPRTTRIGD